jgi:hypothetical protein
MVTVPQLHAILSYLTDPPKSQPKNPEFEPDSAQKLGTSNCEGPNEIRRFPWQGTAFLHSRLEVVGFVLTARECQVHVPENMEWRSMPAKKNPDWMSTPEAELFACMTYKTLCRLAREGRIGTLKIEGVGKRMWSRADIEALVTSGTRPAKAREFAMA